jgi:thiol:disulfide interchange protein/DsbC/DsbD-like thiol-disulfide interchange protein
MEWGGRKLHATRKKPPATTFVLALLALAAPAVAGTPAGKHVKPSLLAEVESIQPGRPFSVGIRLQMAEGWHTYWKNPADSGLPTRMTWRLPEGFQAGPLQWPFPGRLAAPPLMSYGYEGDVLLPVAITPPQTLSPGSEVRLAGRVDWLECQEACIPGRAELELVLPVRAEAPRPAPANAPLFQATRGHLPVPARGWEVKAAATAGVLALTFRAPQAPSGAYFFSDQPLVVEYPNPQTLHRVAGGHRLDIARAANGPALSHVTGVLLVEGGAAPVAVEVDVPVSPLTASPGAGIEGPPPGRGLAVVLAFAFLGGLALNLMPCVLPVLSLKVMGFVRQSGQESPRAWRHGVAFTVGVLVSFWLLAGLMLALRAGGRSVGWGFQLQSPTFVAFLAALFFALGLNLFGVFPLGESLIAAANLNRERTGLLSSFGNGALATIVATPCTAPFMGSALGYGLTQPGAVSLLVFTALALGMAAPYLVLSLNPRLLRLVPRPGAWMEGFQQFLGFLLMATVVALLWLLGREAGVEGMTRVLLALLALGLAAWLYGRTPATGLGPRARHLAPAAAALLLAVGLVLGVRSAEGGGGPGGGGSGLAWEAYSAETLARVRAQGKPVFIDFTAAWCLTCQVNERVALASSEVQDRFRREGVVALRADWTKSDQDITSALASYGRQGVPLYVVYPRDPGRPPRVLPEVITPGIVLAALDDALGDARAARGLTSDITSPQ